MNFRRLGSRSLPSLTLDGLERATELTEYLLAPSDSDDLTLADPFAEQEWSLDGKAYQSLESTSLYRFTRDHSGEEIAFYLRPEGTLTPTVNAPHYRGRLIVGPKPSLGGSASARLFLFEFSWRVIGEPEEVTA